VDRWKWRKVLLEQAQEVGLFAQRHHVDQPRAQTKGQGGSGDGLRHKQVQVLALRVVVVVVVVVGGEQQARSASALSSASERGAFAPRDSPRQHTGRIRTRQRKTRQGLGRACRGAAASFPPPRRWSSGTL
jgi:hypothetical protein